MQQDLIMNCSISYQRNFLLLFYSEPEYSAYLLLEIFFSSPSLSLSLIDLTFTSAESRDLYYVVLSPRLRLTLSMLHFFIADNFCSKVS